MTKNRNRSFSAATNTDRSPEFTAVLAEAKKAFTLNLSWTDHGPEHWERVERNAVILARATPGCDVVVARAFALLHDCKRQDEGKDSEHGARAAEFARKLQGKGVLRLEPVRLALLLFAMEHHNSGRVSDDPTIGVCWDADRLDLPRVGTRPVAELMSTKAGKRLLGTDL